jgi:hypothetical protein
MNIFIVVYKDKEYNRNVVQLFDYLEKYDAFQKGAECYSCDYDVAIGTLHSFIYLLKNAPKNLWNTSKIFKKEW